uniref:PCI domain-containing protein n=1 Tax=Octactis speculum TaxID=3111310 RepID=A0A7S2B8S3_9STRA
MVEEYSHAIFELSRGQHIESYKHLVAAWDKLLTVFRDETGWLLPLVHQSTFDIRKLATMADESNSTAQKSGDQKHLRETGRLLSNGFSICWNDRTDSRSPESKKRGVLYVIVNLFKTYFKLNTLRLCKNLIKAVEVKIPGKPSIVELDVIPRGDLVAYRFFVGRLNMFEDQYADAERSLDYALKHCRSDAWGNKRRILAYLIPIKLYRGILPSKHLLQKYKFNEFMSLCEAVRCGHLEHFNQALHAYQDVFIRKGTYLVLEKVKTLVYRNLIKRIFLVAGDAKTKQLKLARVLTALTWLNETLSLDEIECIIANLIFKGYIKGYISHKQRVLVLSKNQPFPIDKIRQQD